MTTFEELFAVKLPIDPVSRESMLRDNANAMERGFGYTKRFTNEELELKVGCILSTLYHKKQN